MPGYGLSRQVVFTHIPYYLGPSASVRPFSYQQREGYLISNPGAPLTKVYPDLAPPTRQGVCSLGADCFSEPD